MKHTIWAGVAIAVLAGCVEQAPLFEAQTYANDDFGFTLQVPTVLMIDAAADQPGGDAMRNAGGDIRAVVWGAPFPEGGLAALAQGDFGRLAEAGLFITNQGVSDDSFFVWATSPGSQVLIQQTWAGTDCDGQPIVASFLYGFDRDVTDGELRLATNDPGFPQPRFGANCP